MRGLLGLVGELLRGGRYNRRDVARLSRRSLTTADRWIKAIAEIIPGARLVRMGKTTWIEHSPGVRARAARKQYLARLERGEDARAKGDDGRTRAHRTEVEPDHTREGRDDLGTDDAARGRKRRAHGR